MKRMFSLAYLFVMAAIALAMITTSVTQTRMYEKEIVPAFVDYAISIADSIERELIGNEANEAAVLDRWLSSIGFGLSVLEMVNLRIDEAQVESATVTQLAESVVVLVPISENRAIRVGYEDEYTTSYIQRAVGIHLAVYLALALMTWWLTNLAFRYFDQLGERTRDISEGRFEVMRPAPPLPGFQDLSRNIESMAQLLADRYQAQATFIGAAAHELRGPYTRMRLSLDMAQERLDPQRCVDDSASCLDGKNGSEILNLFEELDSALDDATNLTDEMLSLARISLAGEKPSNSVVELHEVIRELIESIGDPRIELYRDQMALVASSKIIVRSVLQNLLQNAQRHANKKIIISIHKKAAVVRVLIEDDGDGFTHNDSEKLFTPFYSSRAPELNDTNFYGLGLAFAEQAMRASGGKIEAENRTSGGACFAVEWYRVPEAI